MPAMPPPTTLPTWKKAWDSALYGAGGFYRTESPVDHFRTSVHASPLLAQALLRLVRSAGLDTVVDVGAGRGELLAQLHSLDPTLTLLGVEVAPRPAELPAAVAWSTALPRHVDGLVVALEWLDNVPCHVVEVDAAGERRLVHVDPATGAEALGSALDDAGVPETLDSWCREWWSLPREPGLRAEVGTTRDRAWADVVSRVDRGVALAVDYGHTTDRRPPAGSLRSYRAGREVDVVPDGSRDVTAHVAVDAVAASAGGRVLRQAGALRRLGVVGTRPPRDLAETDPRAYLRALARSTEAAELTATGGLGDHYWMVSCVGVSVLDDPALDDPVLDDPVLDDPVLDG
jgi:SAM-dependent MidA family methyltransferase